MRRVLPLLAGAGLLLSGCGGHVRACPPLGKKDEARLVERAIRIFEKRAAQSGAYPQFSRERLVDCCEVRSPRSNPPFRRGGLRSDAEYQVFLYWDDDRRNARSVQVLFDECGNTLSAE